MSMITMIFVILIMNNSNLRTLPPSLVGRNNDIGCDIDVLDIYDRVKLIKTNLNTSYDHTHYVFGVIHEQFTPQDTPPKSGWV